MHSDLRRFLFPKLLLKFMKSHNMNTVDERAYTCWLLDFLGLNHLNDIQIVQIYNSLSDEAKLGINNGRYASRSPFRKITQTSSSFLCRYDALYELGQLLLKDPSCILDPKVVDFGFYQDRDFVETVIAEAKELNSIRPNRQKAVA
ncbi:hypothetical protein [Ileibacterium valens]|uniref:Uncharacterized protein n=1 Tax=Ileibacterium valens TaxID=1862668 RepID=A0A1U7NJC1_9FIRM|nr:hypothetical protein [Ileibacterium valens]OLU38432.1 hypothetical protein BM735_09375 [Erysipelotrichaceae bacterium NYU-BL-F16]OLU43337.1 hypothetical protein BO222_00260 [Ileibacterium valens]OLU43492.1 hypothetical protein BO224_00045 [Erysipelotrichaceae bacterium NYU-BL-E8]